MQYATKLKAYPLNSVYDCIFNPLYENVYDKKNQYNSTCENYDIKVDDIAPMVIHENPSWLNPKPIFNF